MMTSLPVPLIFAALTLVVVYSLGPPSGAYIHVPFCRRRCFYCNFPVVVLGERESTQQTQGEAYTNLLLREISVTTGDVFDGDASSIRPLETIYFGGGTPSLLPVECLEKVIMELNTRFGISSDTEITLEMDPGTFDDSKLKSLRSIGFNRLSIGIQSFDDLILQKCGRAHSIKDVQSAIACLQKSDFRDNFSVDLISSLPYLTPEVWRDTLRMAVDSGAAHVSVYDLQVEDKTAFGRWYTPGTFPLPSDEVSANMYRTAVEVLTSHGFEHYEVSNYARPGKRSRHNQKYWSCESTLGFGMGAASFMGSNRRFSRPGKMQEYVQWLERLESEGFDSATTSTSDGDDDDSTGSAEENGSSSPIASSGNNDVDVLEVVMLSLRTADGLDLDDISHRYGEICRAKIQRSLAPFVSRGLVRYDQYEKRKLMKTPEEEIERVRRGKKYTLLAETTEPADPDPDPESQSELDSTVGSPLISQSASVPEGDRRSRSSNSTTTVSVVSLKELERNVVRLVDPDGFLLSNDIISSVFAELS